MKTLPYPPTDGFRADVWDRIRSMHRLGYAIHLLVMAPKIPVDAVILHELYKLVDRIDFVPRAPLRQSVATVTPTLVARNKTLATTPLTDEYDVTLAESEHVLRVFDNPFLRTRLRVLRVHNRESKYMWELARSDERPAWKAFFAIEALRCRWFAGTAYRNVDAIWFISRDEYEHFCQIRPAPVAAAWLPPALTIDSETLHRRVNSKRVLFLGGLKNPLNRDGVRWYIDKVHPLLLNDPDYTLVIAGNADGSPAAHRLAAEASRIDRCTVHLSLTDLAPLYDSCAVIINPMRRGSGVKMKTIHAIQHRIPVVTTPVGVEGSGFTNKEHVLIADHPRAFADAIRAVLSDPALGDAMTDRSHQYLTSHYNGDRNIEALLSSLLPPPNSDNDGADCATA